MPNLLDNLPTALASELVDVLAESKTVRIERIVSTGQASPAGFWYDQAESEWVVLLAGSAKIKFEDLRTVSLRPGDHLLIEPHQRHRVEQTSGFETTVWLAVFFQD